jgi:hypothetical protein
VQVVPQPPQLAGSTRGSTHEVPHCSNGAPQIGPHVPSKQSAPAQSAERRHPRPAAHAGHVPPPQSTSVSAPFFTPSVQVGIAPPSLAQGWQGPPQSTAASPWFCTPSRQLAAAHRLSTHEPLAQSASARHRRSAAHAGQSAPPQSTSVSRPSMRPLAQSAGRGVIDTS